MILSQYSFSERKVKSSRISLILVMIFLFQILSPTVLADTDETEYYSNIQGLEYEVQMSITSFWEDKANIEYVVKNTGDEIIHNWDFIVNIPYSITNIWNAEVIDYDGMFYEIGNSVYNQEILPNQSITIGLTVSGIADTNKIQEPSIWYLNTKNIEIPPDYIALSYVEYSNWSDGFNGAITLTNVSTENIYDWSFEFSSNRSIVSVSNAIYSADETDSISNDGYNTNLLAGESWQIGVNGGSNDGSDFDISIISFNGYGTAYSLFEDINGNNVADYLEEIYGEEGPEEPQVTVTPTPTEVPSVSPSVVPTDMPLISPSVTPTEMPSVSPTDTPTPEITPVGTPTPTEEISYDYVDTDHDGLSDEEELLWGTDIDNPDTDGDSLSDFLETLMGYSPTDSDSDGDGILDGDEDCDGDGLSNSYEESVGTCCYAPDSDYDGLNDYEEIFVYGTDPRNEFSDDDSVNDGDEIALGKNPNDSSDENLLFSQELTKVIDNGEDNAIVSVSVELSLPGFIEKEVEIRDVYNIDIYSTDVYGRLGSPVEFNCDVEFDSATITFFYDEDSLGETFEENIGILWFDEEHSGYVVQEQAVLNTDANTVTLEVSHFSTYLAVDLQKWNNPIIPVYDDSKMYRTTYNSNQHFDITFGISLMDTMSDQEIQNAIQVINNYIPYIRSGDRCTFTVFGVSEYYTTEVYTVGGSEGRDIQLMMSDIEYMFSRYFNFRYESGPGYVGNMDALAAASTAMFDDNGNSRILVTISDECITTTIIGYSSGTVLKDEFGVYTVNVSEDCQEKPFVIDFTEDSGGLYFADWITTNIGQQVITNERTRSIMSVMIDDDGDGLFDEMERVGILGTNGKLFHSDPTRRDSDFDTWLDSKELGTIYTITRSKDGSTITIYVGDTCVYSSVYGIVNRNSEYAFLSGFASRIDRGDSIVVCAVISNPESGDDDGDGYFDNEDALPSIKNPDIIYLYTNPDFYDCALFRKNLYENNGYTVRFFKFYDYESFKYAWNGIGLYDDYFNSNGQIKRYGDSYYYNAKYVVIETHGSESILRLNSINDATISVLHRYDLFNVGFNDRKMDSLNLYACSCGKTIEDGNRNIAQTFLDVFSGIKQVIAPDTTLWGNANHYYFLSYSEEQVINDADFWSYVFEINNSQIDGKFYSEDTLVNNARGFIIITRDSEPIDVFDNDVFYGTKIVSEDSIDSGECVLLFDDKEDDNENLDTISNNWHDPILGE